MSRAAQKRATRDRILQAARATFEAHGYTAARIGDIATAAGVSAGSVLAHFPDKPSLLAAARHDDLQQAIDHAFATLPDTDTHGQLQHIARELYAFFDRDLLRETLFLDTEHGAALQHQLTRLTERVAQLLRPKRSAEWIALGFFADWLAIGIAGLNGAFDSPKAQLAALDALTRLRVK